MIVKVKNLVVSCIALFAFCAVLSACGGSSSSVSPVEPASATVVAASVPEPATSTVVSDSIEEASSTVTASSSSSVASDTVSAAPAGTDDATWKEFLKEYEEFVDNYIIIYKKYQANPTDATLLADYTELMQKLPEWEEKAADMQAELASNPEALKEYTETLAQIAQKLIEAL